jgi:RND family efflux transporter MFP subunit
LKIADPLEQVADVVSSVQLEVVVKAGGDVHEIDKKSGEYVNKGDVIFRLDSSDAQLQRDQSVLQVKSVQAQLAKAKEDLENSKTDLTSSIAKLTQAVNDAQNTYNKANNDYAAGSITKLQLDQFETQLNNQMLDLTGAQKKLKSLESTSSLDSLKVQSETAQLSVEQNDRNLSHLAVTAQISGVITDLPIDVGMTVQAGFKAVTIQQLDPIKIKANLTEASAKLVRGKRELSFYIPGIIDNTKAKVSYLADVMNAATDSYSLELEVPNPGHKLRPGMKAQVLLTDEAEETVVAVPTLSVIREGSDTFVYLLNGDHAEKRKVELGRLNGGNQEILSGVKEGEQLVVTGQNQLKDQEKVQVSK